MSGSSLCPGPWSRDRDWFHTYRNISINTIVRASTNCSLSVNVTPFGQRSLRKQWTHPEYPYLHLLCCLQDKCLSFLLPHLSPRMILKKIEATIQHLREKCDLFSWTRVLGAQFAHDMNMSRHQKGSPISMKSMGLEYSI